ncbi:MAG: glycine--tRNA ligase subunit beta, partial [Holosporales bacterium]|nr:glycine--tRNA ligase subunit beta [Holosporales bacterium]
MQQELLLEIFSEEIPARLQKDALHNAKTLMTVLLKEHGARYECVTSFVSTRRVTLCVDALDLTTNDLFEEKRGPKLEAPQSAIDGFLRSNNKTINDLVEIDDYYYLNIMTPGVDIKSVIPTIIEEFIERFPWPKTMRWYLEKEKELSTFWIRPIRSILCIYDGNPINAYVKSVGIEASDFTYGHRFLSSDPIRVFDFDDYAYKLEKNYVMLDYKKKADHVDLEMASMAAELGLIVHMDEDLINEVAGLVDYPFMSIGSIEESFMNLPREVLSTSMKVHQKYFTLTYSDGLIAPFFGNITNVPSTEIMRIGFDRVLKARLSDAAFFFKEDTDISLDAFAQRLSNVVFHEKLGSVGQKVDRMLSIAETKEENRAVSLCKADLVTQMVGEFPELQGVMGAIYALHQEEDKEVAKAIREHYKPQGANDDLPETYIGARLSFFDKLDTVVGFIGIGIYPTGSRDPFALRRAASSIVRLICDCNVLAEEKLSYYVQTLITSYSDQGIAIDISAEKKISDFITERLKVYMSDKLGIDYPAVEAVVSSYDNYDFDFDEAIRKATTFAELLKMNGFEIVQNAYKRVKGVLANAKKAVKKNIKLIEFNNKYANDLKDFLITVSMSDSLEEDLEKAVKLSELV